MLNAVMIFIGISLDNFTVMMNKGATLRDLSAKKAGLYALVFAVIKTLMFAAGFFFSVIFKEMMPSKLEIMIAAVIIQLLGLFVITKSLMKGDFVERLDKDFSLKTLFRLAIFTSVDTLFIGAGFSLLSINPLTAHILAFCITFADVFVAEYVGYFLGAAFQKPLSVIGGVMMLVFGLYIFATYVMR